jgi:hypothetical protein
MIIYIPQVSPNGLYSATYKPSIFLIENFWWKVDYQLSVLSAFLIIFFWPSIWISCDSLQ